MKQQEITKYNKRCAKFLGDEGMQKITAENGFHYPSIDEMRFHSDWNWIMEVVEAIEKLGFFTKILDNGMSIEGVLIIERWGESKKEGVIETINQFLIWYEQNK